MAGAVIGAGASIYSANQQKKANDKGVNAQVDANQQNIGFQSGIYNATTSMNQPARTAGGYALQRQAALLGLDPNLNINGALQTPQISPDGTVTYLNSQAGGMQYATPGPGQGWSGQRTPTNPGTMAGSPGVFGSFAQPFTGADLTNDPGYQFRLEQGAKTVDRAQAASGHGYSGSALEAALNYSSGLASQEFNQAFSRNETQKVDQYNMLSGLTGGGQIATNANTAAGTNAGSAIGSSITGIGDSRAAGAINEGNIWSHEITGVNNAITGGMAQWHKDHP